MKSRAPSGAEAGRRRDAAGHGSKERFVTRCCGARSGRSDLPGTDGVRAMNTLLRGVAAVGEPEPGTPPAGVPSPGFNWTFVLLSCWLIGGAYLDAWHHHNLIAPDTNPFTPYHFLLYSAEAAIAIFLGVNVLRNFRRFGTPQDLLPDSYGISLLGSVLFGIGGALDILWHLRFGIEVSVAALFSPTHLLLMLSGGLIVSGPLRAAVRDGGTKATWPAVVSGALTLSIFTFWAQFDQPFMQRWASPTEEVFTSTAYIEELGLLGLTLSQSWCRRCSCFCSDDSPCQSGASP